MSHALRYVRNTMLVVAPVAVLAGAVVVANLLYVNKPAAMKQPPPKPLAPLVRALQVEAAEHSFRVLAHGNVVPRREATIVPEVSGRVTRISPVLVAGGFFRAGDELLQIDAADFVVAVANAELALRQAERTLAQEQAEARLAIAEWKSMGKPGEPPELVARVPQLAEATARVTSAQQQLERAKRDLERTIIRAPFDGRVRSVEIGQTVQTGRAIAQVYTTDAVEVRLPLPVDDLAFLDLPLGFAPADLQRRSPRRLTDADAMATPDTIDAALLARFPPVTVRGTIGRTTHEWRGRVVRTEGQIDARSRVLYAIVRVDRPFESDPGRPDRPPLLVGLFVECEIGGAKAGSVTLLPRTALREGDTVFVADADDTLRFRQVTLLRRTPDRVVVDSGLEAGDRVILSAVPSATDGMAVRVELVDRDGKPLADSTEPVSNGGGHQ